MVPVCSVNPSCSVHSQIAFHGGLSSLSHSRKDFDVRCTVEDRAFMISHNATNFQQDSLRATKSLYPNFVRTTEQSFSLDFFDGYSCQNKLRFNLSNVSNCANNAVNERHSLVKGGLKYVEGSATERDAVDFTGQSENADMPLELVKPETLPESAMTPDNSLSISKSIGLDDESLSSTNAGSDDLLAGISDSFDAIVNKAENAVNNSVDMITSSLKTVIKGANDAIDNTISGFFSALNQTGERAADRLSSFSAGLNQTTQSTSLAAADALRRTIVTVEDSLASATSFFVYSYGSTKELLSPEIRDTLNLAEAKAAEILGPVGTGLQQVYLFIEGLEKSVGLDPNDPIVPFVLFLGSSATLWVAYWVWTYSGYAGDLSPQSTFELLTGTKNAVLIDIRPEVLREKDGIPDLRRGARFRNASVTLPKVDSSVLKMLKSGRELDDALLAAVIRNLKIVQDSSKVIIMDADGSLSKGVARSLRKLGVKRSYLVQGGFKSWAKQDLRMKELKPETALTILNEEAEAILEDIRPSPVQAVGYGLGFVASLYALVEWEKTLQQIGFIGISLTIYRRLASYQDAKDLKRDVRLLLAPVRLGAQAFSWAAGKLETNRIGLPTSPSSSDVQSRVLQAAAKHESQPSDTDGTPDSSPQSAVPVTENVDLSEV